MCVLSSRELAVVRYVYEGLTNREIAQRLQLSEHTIKNHLFRIYGKLGLSSRLELTRAVIRQRPSSRATFPDDGEVPKDDVAMFQWYSRQAEYSPLALCRLGEMYLQGRGVQKDEITGYICLASAEQTANDVVSRSRAVREQYWQKRFAHEDRLTAVA
jgi:DNA-binding CsgD family transcriptional regulator